MECVNIKLALKGLDISIRDSEFKIKIDQIPLELKQIHLTEELVFLEVDNGGSIIIDDSSIQFVLNNQNDIHTVLPILECLLEKNELIVSHSCVLVFEVNEIKKINNFNYLFSTNQNEFDFEFLGLKAKVDTYSFNISTFLNKNNLQYGIRTQFKCDELKYIEKDVLKILNIFSENLYPKVHGFITEGIIIDD